MEAFVYRNLKLTNSGIISYKVFQNCHRKMRESSLRNLINNKSARSEIFVNLLAQFNQTTSDDQKKEVYDQALCYLNDQELKEFYDSTNKVRTLSPAQSRKIRQLCSKLYYYSQTRKFTSKKSGSYSMRCAFLTLTTPSSCTDVQSLNAFNHFLDYIQRTANCVYVYKKELGSEGHRLHYHLLINNFIPYYIVAWKWKRLLINEGVQWEVNKEGKETESHYRIELPRSRKSTAHYIAKYMSKGEGLPGNCGLISSHSSILDELREVTIIESDVDCDELNRICSKSKVLKGEYVSIICCDLLRHQKIAPELYSLFYDQYLKFSESITLPQKFFLV
jgi:hypothetical protein